MPRSIRITLLFLLLCATLNAQWTTAQLSQARWDIGVVSVGNKVLFAGGKTLNGAQVAPSNRVDVYDTENVAWTTAQLSQARSEAATFALGSKAFFCGGLQANNAPSNRIDIYDASTGLWTTGQLFQARFPLAGIAHDNKLLLAGGLSATGGYSPIVDIYNAQTQTWSSAMLSVPRIVGAVAAVGHQILFAGGYNSAEVSARVDIYNTQTGAWASAELSEARANIAVAVVGDKVYFAGGDYPGQSFGASLTVDIFNATTQTWTTSTLDQQRAGAIGAAVGQTAIFAGGYRNNSNTNVETFDFVDLANSNSGVWTAAALSQPRVLLQADKLGERVFFSGDAFIFGKTVATETIDEYNAFTQSWTTHTLAAPRYWARSTVAGNQLFIAGGLSAEGQASNVVDIYTDMTVGTAAPDALEGVSFFPNPATEKLNIAVPVSALPAWLYLTDASGRLVKRQYLEQLENTVLLTNLSTGLYRIVIQGVSGDYQQETLIRQ